MALPSPSSRRAVKVYGPGRSEGIAQLKYPSPALTALRRVLLAGSTLPPGPSSRLKPPGGVMASSRPVNPARQLPTCQPRTATPPGVRRLASTTSVRLTGSPGISVVVGVGLGRSVGTRVGVMGWVGEGVAVGVSLGCAVSVGCERLGGGGRGAGVLRRRGGALGRAVASGAGCVGRHLQPALPEERPPAQAGKG